MAVTGRPRARGAGLISVMELAWLSLFLKAGAGVCLLMLLSLSRMVCSPSRGQAHPPCRPSSCIWMVSAREWCWIDSSNRWVVEQDNLDLTIQ